MVLLFFGLALASSANATCSGRLSVEVLGSGGPIAESGRASTGYLVWIDGRARLLIDAGGGVFLRYAESGARFNDLDAVLITHFHADHVADLPAILNSGTFDGRRRPLAIVGPRGNEYFPGVGAFLGANFDGRTGAYRYLSGFLDGRFNLPRLEPIEVDPSDDRVVRVRVAPDVELTAIPVRHMEIPALGYVLRVDGQTIVFAGDQSVESAFFEETLVGTNPALLIVHHAISEAPGQPRGLHRSPSSIGDLAAALGAGRLVLGHNMRRALDAEDQGMAAIRQAYAGPIDIAADHSCFVVIP
jgi:ribonuclease BN (tRNA processing enzyme)